MKEKEKLIQLIKHYVSNNELVDNCCWDNCYYGNAYIIQRFLGLIRKIDRQKPIDLFNKYLNNIKLHTIYSFLIKSARYNDSFHPLLSIKSSLTNRNISVIEYKECLHFRIFPFLLKTKADKKRFYDKLFSFILDTIRKLKGIEDVNIEDVVALINNRTNIKVVEGDENDICGTINLDNFKFIYYEDTEEVWRITEEEWEEIKEARCNKPLTIEQKIDKELEYFKK